MSKQDLVITGVPAHKMSLLGRAKKNAVVFVSKKAFSWLSVSAGAYFLQKPLQSTLKSFMCWKFTNFPGYNAEYEVPGLEGRARWLAEAPDRKPDDPILVFFHGGGYVLGAIASEVHFPAELYRAAKNPRLSVLILDYHVAPKHQHPTPFVEARKLWHQLTEVDKNTNITLLGDSAGANLELALIRHLHDPHPDMVPLPSKVAPVGVILVSPWINLNAQEVGSYKTAKNDALTLKTDRNWAAAYCPSEELRKSSWVSPISGIDHVPWTKYLPKNTLLTYGDSEGLRDDCEAFGKAANIRYIVIEKDGIHDSIVYELPAIYDSDVLANVVFVASLQFLQQTT